MGLGLGATFWGEDFRSLAELDGLEVVDGGVVFGEDFGSLAELDLLGFVDEGGGLGVSVALRR